MKPFDHKNMVQSHTCNHTSVLGPCLCNLRRAINTRHIMVGVMTPVPYYASSYDIFQERQ